MAFLERLSQAQPGSQNARAPLVPRKPEVPGAPPKPAMPADKAVPPAAAKGPIGRPPLPTPSFPGGAGRDLPVTGTATPAAPSSPAPRPTAQGAPGQKRPGAQEQLQGPTETNPAASLVHSFDRVPNMSELLDVPEGVTIQTPYGTMDRSGKLTLSPEGEVKYKEAMVKRRKAFGPHPFAGDAAAPPAPARLGGRMFNPFSGQWVD